ncbi:MAG: hypothetical protein MUE56_06445, partial [Ignavibacteria bacterium]|nr:hypothetical protein [Ignavibacteria bacterium]
MSQIHILEIANEVDKMRFIKFPWEIYRGNPNWVPPLIYDVRKNLDFRKNPFYTHAKIKLFLALDGKTPVGRIAAIVNDNHNIKYNDKVGFIGYFDCINSSEVSYLLFDTAKQWLKEQGMDTMRGPINLSINDEVGLLINAFDRDPVLLTMYNPEYYIGLFENYGFKKAKDLYAYYLDDKMCQANPKAMDKLERVADLVLKKEKVRLRKVVLKNLDSEL